MSQVQDLVSGAFSRVKNKETGTAKPYDDMGTRWSMNVVDDAEKFKQIDEEFKELVDKDGVPLVDIARKYWDDPEYAERMRREIAAGKKSKK